MRVLSREEQERFISYLQKDLDPCRFGILLALCTGIRIGELCALRWEYVSTRDKAIKIVETLQRLRDTSASQNDKTKRIILITACCLLCGVAVIGIAGRFGGNTVTPSGTVSGSQPDSNDPNVNINNSQGDVNVPSLTPEQSDPGQGANSNGTEQTIQANPVKPDAPEKPESPSGTAILPDDHKAEDVPTSERKTEDEPHPTYPEQPTSKPAESQPAAGSTNSSGQVYVPGFGYVDSSGDNTVIDGQDIYENGNKIGEMGGGN